MDNPNYWTAAELATLMRVSKMSVYRLIHTGQLEAIRIGRSYRVPDAAVTTYLTTPANGDSNSNGGNQPATPAPPQEDTPCPTPSNHPSANPAHA
jgi:excisionase family DNA binding protein